MQKNKNTYWIIIIIITHGVNTILCPFTRNKYLIYNSKQINKWIPTGTIFDKTFGKLPPPRGKKSCARAWNDNAIAIRRLEETFACVRRMIRGLSMRGLNVWLLRLSIQYLKCIMTKRRSSTYCLVNVHKPRFIPYQAVVEFRWNILFFFFFDNSCDNSVLRPPWSIKYERWLL